MVSGDRVHLGEAASQSNSGKPFVETFAHEYQIYCAGEDCGKDYELPRQDLQVFGEWKLCQTFNIICIIACYVVTHVRFKMLQTFVL